MNSGNFIVKIISISQRKVTKSYFYAVEARVQIAKSKRKKSFDQFKIVIWGKLGRDFLKYYRVGDYIIVRGILSFDRRKSGSKYQKDLKLTVAKFHPFLLTEEGFTSES